MDQHFFVTREERRNVVVQKHIIRQQQHEEPVRLMRSDEFPELYHLNMPTHQQEDHYRPSKYIPNMKDNDTSYGGGGCGWTMKPAGKQYPAPPPHQVHVCQGPPFSAQVKVVVPPQGQNQKVVCYQGNHHHHHQPTQPPPPPPPLKKPAPRTVIDSNEAAKLYNGILIKEFGRNKLPAVKGLVY